MYKILKITMGGTVILLLASYNLKFSFPTSGKVVDAKGVAIEGAVVATSWGAHRFYGQQSNLRIMETKTNVNGSFVIPGWGPNWSVFSPLTVYSDQPEIWIARRGYSPKRILNNDNYRFCVRRWNMTPQGQSKEIRLYPIPNSLDTIQSNEIAGLVGIAANLAFNAKECTRQLIPLLSTEMETIERELHIPNPTFSERQQSCKPF